jgi:hypothetical protein
MVTLDLALGHRMIRLATGVGHAVLMAPGAELGREIGWPVSAEQPRSLLDGDVIPSENTATWNARLAPSYIFGSSKARQALDFSAWPDYSASRRRAEMAATTQFIEDGSMPGDYALLHPSASLS